MRIIEAFAVFLLAAIGSFFGSYMKKKGENLATKEDIEELTRRTKEIEAKIDDQVWNRQRQWELKRDTLLEAIKALALLRMALYGVIGAYEFSRVASRSTITDEQRAAMHAKTIEALDKWLTASERFESGRMLAALLRDANLNDMLQTFGNAAREAYAALANNEQERFERLMESVRKYNGASLAAAQAALGIEAEQPTG